GGGGGGGGGGRGGVRAGVGRAVGARDRGCRFPGCGVRHAQGHHLRHWADGGPTRLDNLALLCRRHHRAVHEEGYSVRPEPDGTLRFSTPVGHPIPEAPVPSAVPIDSVATLVAAHGALGLRIDAGTAVPAWDDDRLDLGWAIGVLHPLANPGADRLASRWP